MKHLGMMLAIFLIICFSAKNSIACTDFRVSAKDGSVLIARSMEFALDMQSNLRTSNRNRNFVTFSPDGKPTLTWKAKYAYVYLDGLNQDFAIDGMNEKGLSFGALYLPGLAGYQSVPAGYENRALPYLNIGDWILSNFDTVDQVRAALPSVFVFEQKIPAMGSMIFPLHFSIYDATGKGIVVEYVAGKLNIYDNKVAVLTNSPAYDWHITNLVNYLHLTPQNPSPVLDNNVLFAATGQGFGMVGLPGDISPPSRFVKTATMMRVVIPADNATNGLNLAQHVINNVDIPRGLAREPKNGNYTNEITQWVVFKDLTHRIFYYRTYDNLSLRAVSMDKLNFAENAPRLKMPIASTQVVQDLTSQFISSVSEVQVPATNVTTSVTTIKKP